MNITRADLLAVRAALTGRVLPGDIARSYSAAQKALLAHAALIAGNFSRSAWKGQFSALLVELTMGAAVFPVKPQWYWHEAERLIPASRQLGLHRGDKAGNSIEIIRNPDVLQLLEEPVLRQAAADRFQHAAAKVNAGRAAEMDFQKRISQFRTAAQRNQNMASFPLQAMIAHSRSPFVWVDMHNEIDRLLREYFPDLLPE
jgi:hypothetical protein